MKHRRLHPWTVSVLRARKIQETLRQELDLSPSGSTPRPRLVAGADVSYNRGSDLLFGAVVILTFPEMKLVEVAAAVGRASFPYVPGYLSFREVPILLKAFRKIIQCPDVILCDGQGIAHPRGFGLASHLGALLETPAIGCAKSRLVGEHRQPGEARGSRASLRFGGRRVGTVLRTRDGVSPVFVSPGWGVDIATADRITLACSRLRVPEPTRQAHMEVNRIRRNHGGGARPSGSPPTRTTGVPAPGERAWPRA